MTYSIYTSVEDMIKEVSTIPEKGLSSYARREWLSISDPKTQMRKEFFGGGTKSVIEKYNTPNPYEAKMVANLKNEIEISDNCIKKRFSVCNKQTTGFMVDVKRYLDGDQRHWYSVKKKKHEYPYVRIFAPMGGISSVNDAEMMVCGALTCAVVEAFEKNCINVELWATCCASGVVRNAGSSSICQMVKIKDASQYCDLRTIYVITGYSGFYRNIVFLDRILAASKVKTSEFIGIGRSYDFTRKCIPEFSEEECKNAILIPRIYNKQKAKEWITDNLNSIVEVNEDEN